MIIVYYLFIFIILWEVIQGKRGLGVEESICNPEVVSSILPYAYSSFFAPENRRKFPEITENFGTLGRKFPGYIEQ